jgi:hypothetical protein
VSAGPALAASAFEGAAPSTLPALSNALATADFDGDGDADVVTLGVDGSVSLATNLGGGLLASSTLDLPAFEVPDDAPYVGMRAADVDADGNVDVFIYGVSSLDEEIDGCRATLLRGLGGGVFELSGSFLATPPEPIDWSRGCTGLELGDFDGDGALDFALAHAYAPFETFNGLDGAFSVYLGQGGGTFAAAGNYPLTHDLGPFVSYALTSGDFDGDGLTDLTFVAEIRWLSGPAAARLETFRGDGTGAFSSSVIHDFDCNFCDLRVARARDYTGDGRPDVVIATQPPDYSAAYPVLFVANQGDGTFAAPMTLVEIGGVVSLETDDFTSDGNADLLVIGSDDSVTLLPGDGAGGFAPPHRYLVGSSLGASVAADVDGDARTDLVLLDGTASALHVALRATSGLGFILPHVTRPPTPLAELVLSPADFDGDGRLDLLAASAGRLDVLTSTGDGEFAGGASVSSWAYGARVPIVDLDGDGWLDLVVPGEEGLVAVLGTAGGGLSAPSTPAPGFPLRQVTASAAGDIDGDGDLDAAAYDWPSAVVDLFANDGAQHFVPLLTLPTATTVGDLYLQDLTADGNVDLFVGASLDPLIRDEAGNGVAGMTSIWPGDGHGGFGSPRLIDVRGRRLLLADVDRNGTLDILSPTAVLLGDGAGDYGEPRPLDSGGAFELALADIDGDRHLDLLSISDLGVSLARGEGGGAFASPEPILPWGSSSYGSLIARDVAGSTAPDLVVALSRYDGESYLSEVLVLQSSLRQTCQPRPARLDAAP